MSVEQNKLWKGLNIIYTELLGYYISLIDHRWIKFLSLPTGCVSFAIEGFSAAFGLCCAHVQCLGGAGALLSQSSAVINRKKYNLAFNVKFVSHSLSPIRIHHLSSTQRRNCRITEKRREVAPFWRWPLSSFAPAQILCPGTAGFWTPVVTTEVRSPTDWSAFPQMYPAVKNESSLPWRLSFAPHGTPFFTVVCRQRWHTLHRQPCAKQKLVNPNDKPFQSFFKSLCGEYVDSY